VHTTYLAHRTLDLSKLNADVGAQLTHHQAFDTLNNTSFYWFIPSEGLPMHVVMTWRETTGAVVNEKTIVRMLSRGSATSTSSTTHEKSTTHLLINLGWHRELVVSCRR
jgi:hypothetical protein